ncbi:MAG: heavy-metal-associated domain-containing protein [Gammaproteobacteria bacterium]|jgi:copper chaperone CopZ|nr:heavy-metal-associated domain-containing protein [Gammaproteobacteria bacterium]MBU2180563.1 heavy-metal-associated domain-containing protein [Gammaproteobacteria bacterium]
MNHPAVFNIKGMSCKSCVGRVEKALTAVTGVEQVQVDLAAKTATVTGTASESDLLNAIQQAGYQASQTA